MGFGRSGAKGGFGRMGLVGVASGAPAWVLTSGATAASLDIDFVNDLAWNNAASTIVDLLTCSRASTGYYTEADGTLQSFSSNVLRYGTNGLLVEEARTNITRRSQELDNAVWTKVGATISADAATAPDGTLTADKIIEAADTSAHNAYQQTASLLTAAVYTQSFYLKAAERSWAYVRLAIAAGQGAWFNLATGAVGTVQSGITASIEPLTDGYYRCSVSILCTAASWFPSVQPATADNVSSYLGDGSSGIYVWGAQLELGAFPTSYILTTASSATRAADVITFADLTWFDGASDSVYTEWIAKNVNNAKVWAFDATNDKLLDEQTGMSARIAGATVATTAAAGATVKAAARLVVNDFAIAMNGGTVAADTTETAPGTLTAARLGCDLAGANHINGYIRRVAAFEGVALNDAALQALTA
jgi:hypothetical protein